MTKRLAKHVLPAVIEWTPHRLIARLLGGFTPIFMLHRIVADGLAVEGHTPAFIEQCLSYIRKHRYNPISLETYGRLRLAGEPVPARSVVFTIDDGFKDQCLVGGEVFGKYDIPLTCFLITDFIDGRLWPWDDQIRYVLDSTPRRQFAVKLMDGSDFAVDLASASPHGNARLLRNRLKEIDQTALYDWLPQFYRAAEVDVPAAPPAHYQPVSWAEANAFVARGHGIAPHTCSHRILSRLQEETSSREITAAAARVRQEVAQAAPVFAYPTGRRQDFGEREYSAAAAAGFSCAVSTVPAAAAPRDHRYALPRFSLPENFTDFIQYLTYIEVVKSKYYRRSRRSM
ncbi:polysaccharide deacetylase family protein [Exilibacterium tricleocarpae]|uniref:Polysaccharide deacetylase family protein n=1 Tax=Exilibacterium tricleocarpae TaxID=2591008 RepID=A0A545T3G1_9GAMM|nr:polysaccharide deacetylase family protein [Exilibacterium tricleocarpae]TQV71761.1 polysaccharide deacetylase family protein [Exilibacterium tricleocarpae]